MYKRANIVLIGPMGAGKSSIGRRLASVMGMAFIDLDKALEAQTGVSVPLIFECEGEAGFRQREQQLLSQTLGNSQQIIATGGGAVLLQENRTQMAANGLVVYLKVDLNQQLERLARDRSRPLLAKGNKRETLEALALVRTGLYESIAELTFDSSGLQVNQAAERLHGQLKMHWQSAA